MSLLNSICVSLIQEMKIRVCMFRLPVFFGALCEDQDEQCGTPFRRYNDLCVRV